jgi:hypothetical protein
LVFPLRDRRDVEFIFSEGLLGLLKEGVKRGEVREDRHGSVSFSVGALVRGHFELADWWVRHEPDEINGQFLLGVAARLLIESRRKMEIARLGVWVRIYDWLESHLDMDHWDRVLQFALESVSVAFGTREAMNERARLEQLFAIVVEEAKHMEVDLARRTPGGVFLLENPLSLEPPSNFKAKILVVRFRRSPTDPNLAEVAFAIQEGLRSLLEEEIASLMKPGRLWGQVGESRRFEISAKGRKPRCLSCYPRRAKAGAWESR